MKKQSPFQPHPAPELTDDDRIRISEVFQEAVVPKLMMMHARNGMINCEFAGEQYGNWALEFKSSRSGLDIVDIEYDPESRSFALPRPHVGRDTDSHVRE